jgi:hypothetical protein
MLITSVSGDPRVPLPRFSSFYTAQMGVEFHKKCVICVTAGVPDKGADVSEKRRFDLGSQLAERL